MSQQIGEESAQVIRGEPMPVVSAPGDDPVDGPTVGVALSGGGVRSAAFGFGALQALQHQLGLVHGQTPARYLSAVSGGSYTAAAVLMAAGGALDTPSRHAPGRSWDLAEEGEPGLDGHPRYQGELDEPLLARLLSEPPLKESKWVTVPSPDPLRRGAVESDYLRVHARYLLEVSPIRTVLQFGWMVLVALVTVTSGALVSGAVGRWLWDRTEASDGHFVVVFLLAMALIFATGTASDAAKRRVVSAEQTTDGEIAARDVVAACWIVVVCGVFAVGYESHAADIAGWFGASRAHLLSILFAAGLGGSSVLGPALIALVRAQLAPAQNVSARRTRLLSLARRALIALVELTLLVAVPLTIVVTYVIGWVGLDVLLPGDRTVEAWQLGVWALVALTVVAVLLGDRALSPHALYRSRLARAFSMVRQQRPEQPEGVDPAMQGGGSQWPVRARARIMQPRLSDLARAELPELLICASVNITESGVAAAGSYARPIVFSPQAITLAGEPGDSVPTVDYENAVGRPAPLFGHSFDATVMSYVALTGAAVSPSMGKYTKYWLRSVMTLLNIRLGAWIPNPAAPKVAERVLKGKLAPWLNRCPGPLLWFREFRGQHYLRARHIYVSDGGHYENLGIVELIRRGCDEVWAIDASDDDRGSWRALSESLNLIASELGCEVTGDFSAFDAHEPLAGAGDQPASGGDTRLINRTFTDVVVRGLRDGKDYEAVIHVVKLGMSADTNPVVRQLSGKYRRFPYDSTLNQLYTAERFDLYRALGYDSAMQAIIAATTPVAADAAAEEASDDSTEIA